MIDNRAKYFEQALSNMVYDAASGGAIRHLVDSGYSVNQIMERLDYPTPKSRVEDTVYQYMTEQGILLEALPVEESQLHQVTVSFRNRKELFRAIRERLAENGKEAYVRCPCKKWCELLQGKIVSDAMADSRDALLQKEQDILCGLTSRERDYFLGVPWRHETMYHRLTDRMLEIAIELALSGEKLKLYFLKTEEVFFVDMNIR